MESQTKKRIGQFLIRNKSKILSTEEAELDLTFLWKTLQHDHRRVGKQVEGSINATCEMVQDNMANRLTEFCELFTYYFPTKKLHIEKNEQDVIVGHFITVSQGIDCPKDRIYNWITIEVVQKKRKHIYLEVFKKYYDALPSLVKKMKTLKEYVTDVLTWVKTHITNLKLEYVMKKNEVKLRLIEA